MGIRSVAFLKSCDTPVSGVTKAADKNSYHFSLSDRLVTTRWVRVLPIRLPHLFVECAAVMNLRVSRSLGPFMRLSIRSHVDFICMRTFLNHQGERHRGVEAKQLDCVITSPAYYQQRIYVSDI
jgi:hypothetical protein